MLDFLSKARTDIGVSVRPAFWVMAAIYGWYSGGGDPSRALTWVVAIGLSLLAHEYGHALAMLAFGSGSDIELQGFGGVTSPRRRQDLATWKRCFITMAGCGTGLLISFAAFQLERRSGIYLLSVLWRVNLVWSFFNLLPMYPLDGGRLMETLFTAAFGPWGKKAALAASILAALAISLYFLLQGSRFNAMLTALFALSGYARMREALRRVAQDDDPALLSEYGVALELMRAGKIDQAIRILIALRRRAGAGVLYAKATEVLGMCFHAQGRRAAAYALLSGLGDRLSPEVRPVLQVLAYAMGRYEESAAQGRRNFLATNDPEAAFLLAQASVRLGDERGALRWLKTAVRHGLEAGAARLRGPEFEALRQTSAFSEIEKSLLSR